MDTKTTGVRLLTAIRGREEETFIVLRVGNVEVTLTDQTAMEIASQLTAVCHELVLREERARVSRLMHACEEVGS